MSEKKSKDLTWLFGLLLLLGLLLIFGNSGTSNTSNKIQKQPRSQFQQEDPKKLELVNRHLKETALTLEQEKLKRKQEAQRILDNYKNTEGQMTYQPSNSFSFDSDSNMEQLTSDLNRSVELHDSELTPEQIIHNALLNKQLRYKENRAYVDAFIEQFVANARAGGWDVKLGPNLEVISVKKIKPRNPSLLNQ